MICGILTRLVSHTQIGVDYFRLGADFVGRAICDFSTVVQYHHTI